MEKIAGKKAGVLGFGIEGESAARFLLAEGAKVFVFDVRKKEALDSAKIEEFEKLGVKFTFDSYPTDLSNIDFFVRSPGISPKSAIIEKIRNQNIEVTSATQIFFDLCKAPIIGITGTKGKGTTSSLIYEMLKKQGMDAYLGGNIGIPPLDFLKSLKPVSRVVLELSSFQLQDLTKSPEIAVFLMVTSEHLDYHKDVAEYVDAKRNILRFQTPNDYAIINRDYPASNESDVYTEGQVFMFSRERVVDRGCYIKDGYVILKDKEEQKIIPIKDILLPGRHNLENVCAAVMAAYIAGVDIKNIVAVLKEFKGLEHRLELVRLFNGVRYYDDSFSTTPETAIAAIEAFEEPEVLILGGSSKNSDFAGLGKTIREAKNIKAIIGIGEEWPRIKAEIGNLSTAHIIEGAINMEQIVKGAKAVAELGDVVILTPACASFDMFKNYKVRGEQFKEEVNKLQ
ncbi:MAG TPA: UDP-N-acetylmuramoyl-L-alanine--D-glutamate ligase [Patescibacteria group bacterium]|nr:UDP-N-acetylmuramoyl-L-alanine--D-glutamate ligase [Patescibacteria group bacterium]